MRKIKNECKKVNNKRYNLDSARVRGERVPKSFWQKMSNKTKLSLIATIAAVTIFTPTLSNAITNLSYPDISQYEISEQYKDNKDTLDYWINEYNNEEDPDVKKYIVSQISDYSNEIENIALNNVKKIVAEQMKENPNKDKYFYNKIEDANDIKITYNVDSQGSEGFIVEDKNNNNLDVELTKNMKDIIREVANLQTLESSGKATKEEIGKQSIKIIKECNDLGKYKFTAQEKKDNSLKIKEIKNNESERDEI